MREPKRSDLDEALARATLTEQLGIALEKIEPGKSKVPTPDFRAVGWDSRPEGWEVSVEVKGLMSEEHMAVSSATRNSPFTALPKLNWLWTYSIDTPNAHTSLAGKYDGSRLVGRKLARALEPLLAVLEQHKIEDYRLYPNDPNSEAYKACDAIRVLLRGGSCARSYLSGFPDDWVSGVVAMGTGFGHCQSFDANGILDTIRLFLSTGHGENMRKSLADEPAEHHGVLVADWTVSDWHIVEEMGEAYIPTQPLELPVEIDILWVIIRGRWIRYDRRTREWKAGSALDNWVVTPAFPEP
ncbi:hypothetical protein AB0F85_28760 [Nocardia fluminea]|uniref:hypothetical protein n=1 Tax=Nocardia fluminea TaxID=134984 RepID=UPI0033F7302F